LGGGGGVALLGGDSGLVMAGERHRGTGALLLGGKGVFVIYLSLSFSVFFSLSFSKALPFISCINKWSVIDDRHSLTDRRSSWRAVLCLVSGEEKRKLRYSAKISALQF
jgi:hypothetical protein